MFQCLRAAACAVALAAVSLPAMAATLTLESTFTLTQSGSGPDTPGLNGATVLLQAGFDDATVFTRDGFNVPRAVASMVRFTISGASVAATNTVYAPTATLGLFASGNAFDGLFTSGPGTNVFIPGGDATFFGLMGLVNQVRLDAGGTVGTRALGDALTLDILNGVKLASGGVVLFSRAGPGGTSYAVNNVTTRAFSDLAPVPLPAALPLLGAGLAAMVGVAFARRRRTQTA